MNNNDLTAAAQGIVSPRLITIDAGSVLYRIGNSAGKYGPMGPWWFTADVMERMQQAAEGLASRDPRKADVRAWLALNARMLLAVKLEFSPADVLLAARATAPLQAYTGTGRPMIDYLGADNAADATVTYTMAPKPWLQQLYLCDFARAVHQLDVINREVLPVSLERMPER